MKRRGRKVSRRGKHQSEKEVGQATKTKLQIYYKISSNKEEKINKIQQIATLQEHNKSNCIYYIYVDIYKYPYVNYKQAAAAQGAIRWPKV